MTQHPAPSTPLREYASAGQAQHSEPSTQHQSSDAPPQYQPSANKDFKIKITGFEGPFDLLLHLIDEKQIELFAVKISDITDAYLAYLDMAEKQQVELGSEFLVMASTLIELKSKLLLPNAEPIEESLLQELEQERMAILNRLFDYKIFKQLSAVLEDRREWAARFFTPDRVGRMLPEFGPAPIIFRNADLQKLFGAFNQVWLAAQTRQQPVSEADIFDDVYTVAECMDFLLVRLVGRGRTSFRSLFEGLPSLGQVIVNFLALLELIRLGRLQFEQTEAEGDILIYANE